METPLIAMWHQVLNSPASVLVIFAISIVAFLLEAWPKFPSKWVPIICVGLGIVAYPFLSSTSSVPKDFPHPVFVLCINGLICGFAASVGHVIIIRRIVNNLLQTPPPNPPAGSNAVPPAQPDNNQTP